MKELKFSELLRLNAELADAMKGERYEITVLSNIITHQLNEVLEYSLRLENINAHVASGNYDNIVQDSQKFSKSNAVIVFWEACNIVDGLQYKANTMNAEEVQEVVNKVKSEIDFVLENLQQAGLVLFNKFSSLVFNRDIIKENNFDRICKELNAYLETKAKSSVILIELDKIIATVSCEQSVDFRYYYSSKALYTVNFYKAYAQFIQPILLSVNGKAKKVLVFDCDNSLWKGILGEDGIEKIEMSLKTKGGVVFEEAQYIGLDLSKRGILVALCSKNNPQDVDQVLQAHPNMILKEENITIKTVNWEDKVSNLRSIAQQLNVGLDSLVFVDDSDFEIELVKKNLPQVSVLKVPTETYAYPQVLRSISQLFYTMAETKEDGARATIYKQQFERESEKKAFGNIENYLKSLEMEVTVAIDELGQLARVAQMTQKTNQFNLTTKRYTEADILAFMESNDHSVLAFEVKDKFGDSGITGVSILKFTDNFETVAIDTFLMSCRIIGRNIEFAFFDFLMGHLINKGTKHIKATYSKTPKNEQVAKLYDQLGFEVVRQAEEMHEYELDVADYNYQNITYIKINHGRKN